MCLSPAVPSPLARARALVRVCVGGDRACTTSTPVIQLLQLSGLVLARSRVRCRSCCTWPAAHTPCAKCASTHRRQRAKEEWSHAAQGGRWRFGARRRQAVLCLGWSESTWDANEPLAKTVAWADLENDPRKVHPPPLPTTHTGVAFGISTGVCRPCLSSRQLPATSRQPLAARRVRFRLLR